MDFGEMIYRTLSGGLSSHTESADLPRMLSAILKAAGSPTAAARIIGVHPSTLRRWRAGTASPSARSAPLLQRAVRRARLTPRREARIRASAPALRVVQRDNGRRRDLDARNFGWRPGASNDVVDAFLAGASPADLRKITKKGIRDRWYQEWIDADYEDVGPDLPDPDTYGFDVLAMSWAG